MASCMVETADGKWHHVSTEKGDEYGSIHDLIAELDRDAWIHCTTGVILRGSTIVAVKDQGEIIPPAFN